MSLYKSYKCEETGGEFYECRATKLNAVTSGKDVDVIIKTVTRYIYFNKPATYKNIDFNGRQANKVMTMFAYPEDLLDIRVGTRFRFNLTNKSKRLPFDPNLKPFSYAPNQKDIFDLEVHAITPYQISCDEPHIEIILVSYN